jgi:hypothetical protein
MVMESQPMTFSSMSHRTIKSKAALRIALVLLLCSASAALLAQQTFEKVLLPVVLPSPVPGAFGSVWKTQITFLNKGADPLFIANLFPCNFDPCLEPSLPPDRTVALVPRMNSSPIGKFLGIARSREQDLQIELRVFDASRTDTSFGTHIPVVPESAAQTGTVDLLGVPTTVPFRSLLRIYDFDPDDSHTVAVNLYRQAADLNQSDQLVATTTARLLAGPYIDIPGYAEIDVSSTALGQSPVRVEIKPVTTGLRFWAMVSVTNNDTQHVTMITPQYQ